MSAWETKRYQISEIAKIKSGKRLPAGCDLVSYATAHPYIRSRDIKNGKLLTDNLAYITDRTYEKISRYIITKGDIAITIVANIGDIGYCEEDCDGANLTENAVRLTEFSEDVDGHYLAYYLNRPSMKHNMESLSVGAAQAKLGIYKIEKIEIDLPPLPIQQRIASILSDYDAAIANCRRQIALLEEAAQRLYREWFAEGKGEKKCLGDVCDVLYGKPHKDIADGNIPIYGSGGVMRYGNRAKYCDESVLIPRKGTLENIMYVDEPFWVVDTMFYTHFKIKNMAKIAYFQLSSLDMRAMNTGSAVPSMTTDTLYKLKLAVPEEGLRQRFDEQVSRMYMLRRKLKQHIGILTEARDRLLPKLMSGEVAV